MSEQGLEAEFTCGVEDDPLFKVCRPPASCPGQGLCVVQCQLALECMDSAVVLSSV